MKPPLGLTILGSTGSIGTSTLEVVRHHPDRLRVVALGAQGRRPELLLRQALEFRPELVAVADPDAAPALRRDLPAAIRVVTGVEGLREAAIDPASRRVVAAMVGAAGLEPVFAAIDAGRDVALANKEALVVAGSILVRRARQTGSRLLPIDSEHAALDQALRCGAVREVRRLVLTASGGPFLDRPLDTWEAIRPEDALRHPTWSSMGRKITVDSATLVNKALELVEATHLFDVPHGKIEIVVHPQSIVHSLVEYHDGSWLAQLSPNDMVFPIQYALSWPERWANTFPPLVPAALGALEFRPLDEGRFPAPGLARAALEAGESAPAVFNAANEVAVAAFLTGRARFTDIVPTLEAALAAHTPASVDSLADALAWDDWGRRFAEQRLGFRA